MKTKSRIQKTMVFKKIGYSVLGLRKPNFTTKLIPFEKSHKAENFKRGPFEIFFTIHSFAKLQKNEGGRGAFWSLQKNFEKKQKMRNFNSLIVPKNLKKRNPLGFFNIHSVAKYQTN